MSGKAESRLIYGSISTSERVASLGTKGALLYTWLITHCDSQGRILGKPMSLKALIFPLIEDINLDDIIESFEKMAQQKLIINYFDDKGKPLIQIADWWEYQTKLLYKSPSRYQAPEGWEDQLTPRDELGRFVREDN